MLLSVTDPVFQGSNLSNRYEMTDRTEKKMEDSLFKKYSDRSQDR